MAQTDYTAQVSRDVAKTKELMRRVFLESAERTVKIMQTPVKDGGNLPVDTGWLRGSIRFGLGEVNFALTDNPNPDAPKGSLDTFDMGAMSLLIADADLSDTITAVYTANYARPQEYGSGDREGRGFVRLAAQQWPRTVEEVVAEVKASTGG